MKEGIKSINELIEELGNKFEGFRCESQLYYGFHKTDPLQALNNLAKAITEDKNKLYAKKVQA